MVRSEDWLSTFDAKNTTFYRFGQLILSKGEERVDNGCKPAMMTFHTMSLAGSQFSDHFHLHDWVCVAQLIVHRAIAADVSTHYGRTNYRWEFLVDCSTLPSESKAGDNFRYDGRLKLMHNATKFFRLNQD